MEKVFYSGEEDDPIAPRVDAVIVDIARTCRAIIDSRGTLFTIVNRKISWWRKGQRPAG